MDSALSDAVLVRDVWRCSAGLEQCILALEQEHRGSDESSISDSEAVSDSEDERYEPVGPRLAVRPVVQQKVKHEQPKAKEWGFVKGPQCD